MAPEVRTFSTGATRSGEAGRYDPEGFLSPIALERYCIYMNRHRQQPDGSIRDSDNWQKGIPLSVYMKGLWRHLLHAWTRHRGFEVQDGHAADSLEEDLCAVIFNAQGALHELLKGRRSTPPQAFMEPDEIDQDAWEAALRQEPPVPVCLSGEQLARASCLPHTARQWGQESGP
jgi:hypothetical protein